MLQIRPRPCEHFHRAGYTGVGTMATSWNRDQQQIGTETKHVALFEFGASKSSIYREWPDVG